LGLSSTLAEELGSNLLGGLFLEARSVDIASVYGSYFCAVEENGGRLFWRKEVGMPLLTAGSWAHLCHRVVFFEQGMLASP
jgi:hypothetical protein